MSAINSSADCKYKNNCDRCDLDMQPNNSHSWRVHASIVSAAIVVISAKLENTQQTCRFLGCIEPKKEQSHQNIESSMYATILLLFQFC
ncbi:hypothetical protein Ngar_c34080 [Candidatus Nitrososphaera gargensis Ga9.2]|uniref:Uncharacterized protein n=1 Tax=Nitrososphaera gargensis (strain Ga9.2) TaxID=1237085 RepID=K0ILC8_NITGG|nr:hypothetical protein Ngar_c34080 [Candidatus Nitrososphaera gargensis Ga9.2]